ncbi:hypothetical protein I3760_03G057300 [Carya illinoinensis]|nr:hypothetical protein I3760_03G057300 [Carya illinoinensis]
MQTTLTHLLILSLSLPLSLSCTILEKTWCRAFVKPSSSNTNTEQRRYLRHQDVHLHHQRSLQVDSPLTHAYRPKKFTSTLRDLSG